MKSCKIKIGSFNGKDVFCGDECWGKKRYCSYCSAHNDALEKDQETKPKTI